MSLEFKLRPVNIKTIISAIIISFLVGGLIVLSSGYNPAEVYYKLFKGALGSKFAIASTLRWITPLLFTSVASAIAFRGGMFNMGVEGQLYIGALAGTIVGVSCKGLPHLAHVALCFLAAMTAGMFYAMIPALMRVYLNASEVVTTLMLNYMIINLNNFIIQEYFLATDSMVSTIATNEIEASAKLTSIMPPYSVNTGLIIGAFMIVLFYILFNKSKLGYEFHISGVNPQFARYGGIQVDRVRIGVMLISGCIAGLGGAVEIMGVQERLMASFSPNFGFDGMLAALLGNSTPLGVTLSSVFFGTLKAGALSIERTTDVSRALADVIKGIIICFVSVRTLGLLDRISFKWPGNPMLRNKGKGTEEVKNVY